MRYSWKKERYEILTVQQGMMEDLTRLSVEMSFGFGEGNIGFRVGLAAKWLA